MKRKRWYDLRGWFHFIYTLAFHHSWSANWGNRCSSQVTPLIATCFSEINKKTINHHNHKKNNFLINIKLIIPCHATQKLISLSFFSSSHSHTGSQKLIGLAYIPEPPPQAWLQAQHCLVHNCFRRWISFLNDQLKIPLLSNKYRFQNVKVLWHMIKQYFQDWRRLLVVNSLEK